LRLLGRIHEENQIAEPVDTLERKRQIDGSRRRLAEVEEFGVFGQPDHTAREFIFEVRGLAAAHVLSDRRLAGEKEVRRRLIQNADIELAIAILELTSRKDARLNGAEIASANVVVGHLRI